MTDPTARTAFARDLLDRHGWPQDALEDPADGLIDRYLILQVHTRTSERTAFAVSTLPAAGQAAADDLADGWDSRAVVDLDTGAVYDRLEVTGRWEQTPPDPDPDAPLMDEARREKIERDRAIAEVERRRADERLNNTARYLREDVVRWLPNPPEDPETIAVRHHGHRRGGQPAATCVVDGMLFGHGPYRPDPLLLGVTDGDDTEWVQLDHRGPGGDWPLAGLADAHDFGMQKIRQRREARARHAERQAEREQDPDLAAVEARIVYEVSPQSPAGQLLDAVHAIAQQAGHGPLF